MLIKRLKDTAAGVITPACAFAVRHPHMPLRKQIWHGVCAPYLSYRDRPFAIQTACGFRFAGNAADLVSRYVYYFGIWEPAITANVQKWPLQGRTFVDVGAHFGWYSLLVSGLVGDRGRVVSVEASPFSRQGLERNIALNGFRNIRVIAAAAWREEAVLNLYSGPAHNLGMTSLKTARGDAQSYEVKASPLSTILTSEEIDTAALLKIDVEGAESEVLEGLVEILPRFPDDLKIILELTPDSSNRHEWVLETMRQFGFRAYRLPNDYSADAYLSPRPSALEELLAVPEHMVDVVFSRQPLS